MPKRGSVSRRGFIALAGSSVAAGSLLSACGGDSSASADETSQFGDGDVGILNFLLSLEYLQVAFYAELAKSNRLSPPGRKAIGGKFGEEEEEHVEALTKAVEKLGGEPPAKPQPSFSLKTDTGALETASKLEDITAASYLGQLPNVESDSVLSTLLSIHSVEGRHAAAIAELLEASLTPDGAFAKPATVKEALKAVKAYTAVKAPDSGSA